MENISHTQHSGNILIKGPNGILRFENEAQNTSLISTKWNIIVIKSKDITEAERQSSKYNLFVLKPLTCTQKYVR